MISCAGRTRPTVNDLKTVYFKKGGLMLQAERGPDAPLANIDAICRAMERLCKPPDPRQ